MSRRTTKQRRAARRREWRIRWRSAVEVAVHEYFQRLAAPYGKYSHMLLEIAWERSAKK